MILPLKTDVAALGCDVTIDEMLYLTEVINDLLGASRRNIHLYPILLSLRSKSLRAFFDAHPDLRAIRFSMSPYKEQGLDEEDSIASWWSD